MDLYYIDRLSTTFHNDSSGSNDPRVDQMIHVCKHVICLIDPPRSTKKHLPVLRRNLSLVSLAGYILWAYRCIYLSITKIAKVWKPGTPEYYHPVWYPGSQSISPGLVPEYPKYITTFGTRVLKSIPPGLVPGYPRVCHQIRYPGT